MLGVGERLLCYLPCFFHAPALFLPSDEKVKDLDAAIQKLKLAGVVVTENWP